MGVDLSLEIVADARSAAQHGAEIVAERAREAVAERGRFSFGVSGGRTPWLMLAVLAGMEAMPWDDTDIFQVDERIASPGSPERNLTHLVLTLPIEKQSTLHPMPVTRRDLDAAAAEYAEALPDPLDMVHLGLSQEGHPASLVPGDPVLEVTDRRVALTDGPYEGHRRMTMTYPTINSARSVLWLVTGDEKESALEKLLAGDRAIPAAQIARESATVVADTSATGGGRPAAPLDTDPAA